MKTLSTATIRATAVPWKQSITTGNHQLVGDEGKGGGGQDAGPAPYDYLLASLGSCTAITLQMYAQHKGWELVGLEVELSLTKDNDGEVHMVASLLDDGGLFVSNEAIDHSAGQVLEELARWAAALKPLRS